MLQTLGCVGIVSRFEQQLKAGLTDLEAVGEVKSQSTGECGNEGGEFAHDPNVGRRMVVELDGVGFAVEVQYSVGVGEVALGGEDVETVVRRDTGTDTTSSSDWILRTATIIVVGSKMPMTFVRPQSTKMCREGIIIAGKERGGGGRGKADAGPGSDAVAAVSCGLWSGAGSGGRRSWSPWSRLAIAMARASQKAPYRKFKSF